MCGIPFIYPFMIKGCNYAQVQTEWPQTWSEARMLTWFAESVKDSLMTLRSFWASMYTYKLLVSNAAEAEEKHKRGHLFFGTPWSMSCNCVLLFQNNPEISIKWETAHLLYASPHWASKAGVPHSYTNVSCHWSTQISRDYG